MTVTGVKGFITACGGSNDNQNTGAYPKAWGVVKNYVRENAQKMFATS